MNAQTESASVIRVDVRDEVATIVIDRQHHHNSLVPPLLSQLREAFLEFAHRDDVKVIVLKAAGKSFSIGGDLRAFQDHQGDGRSIEAFADQLVGELNEAIISIDECDIPIVVAVDGQVTGGALGLVLACDIVVVTERASFTPYYVDVGFSPDGGWTAMLPEKIGAGRALAVQLLNDTIGAEEALEWGIAYTKTTGEQLDNTIAGLCARLLQKKIGSIKVTKRLLRRTNLRERLDNERRTFLQKICGREAQQGLNGFIAKGSSDS